MGSHERELCAWVKALNDRLREGGAAEATPREIGLYYRHGFAPQRAAERVQIFRAPVQSVFAPTASGAPGTPPAGRPSWVRRSGAVIALASVVAIGALALLGLGLIAAWRGGGAVSHETPTDDR